MRKIKLGNRSEFPAFFDMAARFKPPEAHWYGTGFRIGDRAAAYVYLKWWRLSNPRRRLIVIEDNWIQGTEHSRWLTASWMFAGIADEVWELERNEAVSRPNAEALYTKTLWAFWKSFMQTSRLTPDIKPMDAALLRAELVLRDLGIPSNFISVQPLFDAGYDKHRNQTARWWQNVANQLASRAPVLVLGLSSNYGKLTLSPQCHPAIRYGLDPMVSLALISKAALHVGGATGTTLWAPIFRVPTIAVYKNWSAVGQTDIRPISFGKPVVYSPLSDTEPSTVTRIVLTYQRITKEKAHESNGDDSRVVGESRASDQRGKLASVPK
jgi:hypothetical protein